MSVVSHVYENAIFKVSNFITKQFGEYFFVNVLTTNTKENTERLYFKDIRNFADAVITKFKIV